MSLPPILILAASREQALGIAQGNPSGDPPIVIVPWDSLEAQLPKLVPLSGVICEAGEPLRARRGLMEIIRKAYPDAPLISFSGSDGAESPSAAGAEEQSRHMNLDAHLVAPLSSANLRTILSRETRLRSLSRRHADAIGHVRDLTEKLGLLIDTAKAANSLLEPRLVMQLLMTRLQELVHAESWSLYLLVEGSEGREFEVLRGDRHGRIRSFRVEAEGTMAGLPERKPILISDFVERDRQDQDGELSAGGAHRSMICIPLISRGRPIGSLELNSGEGESESRFGERELELVRMLMEPAAITIENAFLFQRLQELSVTDDLTRLYNSRYLNTFLGREIKRAKRYRQSVSIIFLDLDGFMTINDTHGHLAGSRALAEVGRLLRDQVRETDIVSRYGGDEFTIVMPQTGPKEARVLAERLRTGLAEHVLLASMGLAVQITASFGIASFPEHGGNREELISQADQAMYRVKERSKNGVEVAPEPEQVDCQ